MSSLVSVVIPFYSDEQWLLEAIESIKKQSYKNYEIIIVDDGSNCNLSKYKNECTVIHQSNKGAAVARNVGMRASNGKYIAFLDSDDIWHKDKLQIQLQYMEENNFIWSHTSYKYFGCSEKTVRNTDNYGYIFPAVLLSTKIATPTIMIEKAIVEKEHFYFPSSIKEGEDTIMWALIAEKYPIGHIDEVLSLIRDRDSNAKSNINRQLIARGNYYRVIKEKKLNVNIMDKLFLRYSGSLQKVENPFLSKVAYLPGYLYFKLRAKYLYRR